MASDELEIAKTIAKASVDNLFEPYKDITGKLLGGAAEEIGGMLKDEFTFRRHIRLLKLREKYYHNVRDAGFDPKKIPDHISFPILQEASLQDDEDLQEKWANLLANAADPQETNPVLPSFSLILKEFTFREARFLDALYKHSLKNPYRTNQLARHELLEVYVEAGLSQHERLWGLSVGENEQGGVELRRDLERASATIDILLRNGILLAITAPNPIDLSGLTEEIMRTQTFPRSLKATTTKQYHLTELGLQFVKACQAPGQPHGSFAESADVR